MGAWQILKVVSCLGPQSSPLSKMTQEKGIPTFC